MSAKAKSNGRKKCSDRQSKKSLYEKHIPHISEAIGSIISKSRNREFKIRCQELLKVDSPEKVQEAISSKLFTLMLGDQYDPKTPHNKGDDNLSTASCTDTSFGDLADHVENHDEQWSSAGKPFESARNARRQTATESAKNTYGELKRLEFKESHPMESVVTTSRQSHVMSNAIGSQIMVDKAGIVNSDDDFESLESVVFNELPFSHIVPTKKDQKVPYFDPNTTSISQVTQPKGRMETEPTGDKVSPMCFESSEDHFETLGMFAQY